MSDRDSDYHLHEAEQRAEEARAAWKKAKEEMKAAFKQAREERRRRQGASDTERDEIDATMEEVAEAARAFAREVSDEAGHLAQDLWHGARQEWQGNWREQLQKSMGKDWAKDWQGHWVFGGRRFRGWGAGSEETNPFVSAILSRGAGLLALYVLHLLQEQPRHGNDIMRQIEQRTMGSWASNPGAIYPLLSSMEVNGLVQSRWEDPDKRTRRIYQITDQGTQELERLRRVLRPRLMEAIEVLHVLYDDLYGEDTGEPASTPTATGTGESDEGAAPTTTSGPDVGPDVPPEPGTTAHATATDEAAPSGEALTAEEEAAQRAARWRERFGRLFGRGAAPSTYGA